MLLKRRNRFSVFTAKKDTSNYLNYLCDSFRYSDISNGTASGCWGVDFIKKQSHLDLQARKLLNIPPDYSISLKNGYRFFDLQDLEKASTLFNVCSQGESFKTELRMRTFQGKTFYARAQGKAIKNELGDIIGIRGVFQNIEAEKKQELKLLKSLKYTEEHNKWLYQLSHIVSHNLHAQVCNLQLTSKLMDVETLTKDQEELVTNIKNISHNLECTLAHLTTIATLHNVDKQAKYIVIKELFQEVVQEIKKSTFQQRAIYYTEFSEVEFIKYIPAYLKNILSRLIINALKNKHPERECEINVFTYEENRKKFLVVKDNGIGLPQDKIDYLVSKTRTSHSYVEDEYGLGIFLIKSQIDAMGGSLMIESKLGKGAKFTVQLQ
ncbi:PAS domain-containing sensor histidine kinase [uncultured Dokdonia sp.]|uniref:PAS domain-containing sensor histidine kinase n=1 Tax=uncultured Dokdonia sp. TaxID=575653 RepID=UPI002619B7FA|nr:PAS domain-containing sensor histidine kinase [uncultured Dokdonia sp.]